MAKRNRKFRPLIQVENGGVMLLAKAKSLVGLGRARIVNERLRMLNPTDSGYERAPGFTRLGGSVSFDPERGGGPSVIQYYRTNKGRRTT